MYNDTIYKNNFEINDVNIKSNLKEPIGLIKELNICSSNLDTNLYEKIGLKSLLYGMELKVLISKNYIQLLQAY